MSFLTPGCLCHGQSVLKHMLYCCNSPGQPVTLWRHLELPSQPFFPSQVTLWYKSQSFAYQEVTGGKEQQGSLFDLCSSELAVCVLWLVSVNGVENEEFLDYCMLVPAPWPWSRPVPQGDALGPEDRIKSCLKAWNRLRRDWAQTSF